MVPSGLGIFKGFGGQHCLTVLWGHPQECFGGPILVLQHAQTRVSVKYLIYETLFKVRLAKISNTFFVAGLGMRSSNDSNPRQGKISTRKKSDASIWTNITRPRYLWIFS